MEINRQDINIDDYKEIFEKESHHDHKIIKDEHGTLRWKENKTVRAYLKNISLNDLCPLLDTMGFGKNTEVYRKLYRDMGYSLSGYWEIFYWEVNNEEASEYREEDTSGLVDSFDAKQAILLQQVYNTGEINNILATIKKNINADTNSGVLHIYNSLKSDTVRILKEKGFKVTTHEPIAIQKDNLHYSIYWGK